ncbi:MAG: helix-turn-helix transcriptional regulator [Nanoarchaeota archaeon]
MTKRIPDSKREQVREMHLSGLTPDAIMHRFGYSLGSISNIVCGRKTPLPERVSDYEIEPEELSKLMAERISVLKITQTELARKTGYSTTSIHNFYTGSRLPSDDSGLLTIFKALQVNPKRYKKITN